MSAVAFVCTEKNFAENAGLSRSTMRELRSGLKEGVDWKKIDGEIRLSSAGVEKLARVLDANLAIDAASEKNGGPLTMLVLARCMNPRMVLANESGDANAERHLVDVGNNKNFAIGDTMEVGPHDAQAAIYKCLSRTPPDTRRPQVEGSLRDPGNWGQREMNALLERQRKAEER